MPMQTRESCIFCRQSLHLTEYFNQDKIAFLGHYCVAPDDESNLDHQIPFNVCICNNCQTAQNKYLGDLSVVYAHQHNQGIGEIYRQVHIEFGALILSNRGITKIFEIGASIGTLSNIVLDGNTDVTYTIFEPNFPEDSHPRRTVHRDFFEDCAPDTFAGCDALVMSHMLEHFYDPMSILDAVCESANLQHIYLCWPDLDSYAHNKVLNVLTVEHTFYITADFLESVMASKGFFAKKRIPFRRHSLMFHFERTSDKVGDLGVNADVHETLDAYFTEIESTVSRIHSYCAEEQVYLWPCSVHNLYLLGFGLDTAKIVGFADNNVGKIGKRVYGTDKMCHAFKDLLDGQSKVLLNGGPFTHEVKMMYPDKQHLIDITE